MGKKNKTKGYTLKLADKTVLAKKKKKKQPQTKTVCITRIYFMLQILGNKVNYMQLLNLITMGSGVEVNKINTKSYDVC